MSADEEDKDKATGEFEGNGEKKSKKFEKVKGSVNMIKKKDKKG